MDKHNDDSEEEKRKKNKKEKKKKKKSDKKIKREIKEAVDPELEKEEEEKDKEEEEKDKENIISENFIVLLEMGRGSFGQIHLTYNKRDNLSVATKKVILLIKLGI